MIIVCFDNHEYIDTNDSKNGKKSRMKIDEFSLNLIFFYLFFKIRFLSLILFLYILFSPVSELFIFYIDEIILICV